MSICNTCPAPCCTYPIIVGPNSGTEQAIDWVMSEKGVFGTHEGVEEFLSRMKSELLRLSVPPPFFSDTSASQRTLELHGVELEFDRDLRLFLFLILFLCPEFNTLTSRCNNYGDRLKVCRSFFCKDAGGDYESGETIAHIKSSQVDHLHPDIESVLEAIKKIIEDNF